MILIHFLIRQYKNQTSVHFVKFKFSMSMYLNFQANMKNYEIVSFVTLNGNKKRTEVYNKHKFRC